MNSYYTFNPEDAQRFAATQHTRTRINNNELFFEECIYCHSRKDKYTFSISLRTGQFQCKRASCAVKGNMITLARDFNFDIGKGTAEYYNINNANARFKNYGYFATREVEKRLLIICRVGA